MKTNRRAALLAAWTLALTSVIIIGTVQTASAAPPGGYHAITPARILDTRAAIGVPAAAPIPEHSLITLKVAGVGGVPASGAIAVVMNVTAVAPSSPGWVRLTPTGDVPSNVSNLNFLAGQTVPNLVTIKLGTGGNVDVYNEFGNTDILADVVGWYDDGATAGGRYNPLTPARVLDTRRGLGHAGTDPIGANAAIDVQVTGAGGVPASNVSAVVLNMTVTAPSAGGYLTVWPQGVAPRPNVSNLNFLAGGEIANLVTVGVNQANGSISIFNAFGTSHVIADVVGWYDASGTQGSFFHPITPGRILDSREAHVGLVDGIAGEPTVTGFGGIPASGVTAIVANITAANATSSGWITLWPARTPEPDTSTVNFPANRDVPNHTITPLASNGDLGMRGHDRAGGVLAYVDVIFDGFGYFSAS